MRSMATKPGASSASFNCRQLAGRQAGWLAGSRARGQTRWLGNKKALQMVDARGSSGFETLAALNEACNIDAADILAKRFHTELEDRNIQPRLIDLLLPVKA